MLPVKTLQDESLWDLYNNIELPLIHTLLVMEKNGIYIDPVKLEETTVKFKAELEAVQQEIYELAGETFNINLQNNWASSCLKDESTCH